MPNSWKNIRSKNLSKFKLNIKRISNNKFKCNPQIKRSLVRNSRVTILDNHYTANINDKINPGPCGANSQTTEILEQLTKPKPRKPKK